MRTTTRILFVICLSICLRALPGDARASHHTLIKTAAGQSIYQYDRGVDDLNDSDEFFQRAVRPSGPTRDYSKQIEALLRQMTIEDVMIGGLKERFTVK